MVLLGPFRVAEQSLELKMVDNVHSNGVNMAMWVEQVWKSFLSFC